MCDVSALRMKSHSLQNPPSVRRSRTLCGSSVFRNSYLKFLLRERIENGAPSKTNSRILNAFKAFGRRPSIFHKISISNSLVSVDQKQRIEKKTFFAWVIHRAWCRARGIVYWVLNCRRSMEKKNSYFSHSKSRIEIYAVFFVRARDRQILCACP